MDRHQKHQFVENFCKTQSKYSFSVVVRQKGLSSDSVVLLRRELRQAGAVLKVVKNSLVKKALNDLSFTDDFYRLFLGPAAVVWSDDCVVVSKILVDFSKKWGDKLQIVGASLDGSFLTLGEVSKLSALPSLDQLRAQLLGVLSASATNLVLLLQESKRRVVRLLDTHHRQGVVN